MHKHRNTSNSGFTIVELLIVIVVIAVLAAITIVAFNGVQQRARASSASAGVSQANKKLALYLAEFGQYPADLATVGVNGTSQLTFQYTFSNTANPKTFCVTATAGNVSYKITQDTTPVSGGCAGHGQGGNAAITNLSTNPSFESSAASNVLGNITRTNPTVGDAHSGTRVTRQTRNDTANSGIWWDAANPITENTAYTVCLQARGTDTASRTIRIEWINAAGNAQVSNTALQTIASMPSSWTQYCGTATAPVGAGRLRLTLYASGGTVGTYFDVDSVMITEGTTQYNFADGNTTDWVWNGTPNASTSTGPAQ